MTNRVNWTIDTRAIQPRNLQVLRGETVALDVDLTSYGSPVDLAGATCSAYWRSPDMASGAGWYTSPASADGNRVSWIWDGTTMDAGADVYEWFIGVDADGLSYRPCGRIQMLGSPAGNPSAIPIPSPVLDFAKYTVVNSPFPTFAEEGAAINSATSGKVDTSALVETLEDYYTAAQTDATIEAATSGKASRSDLALYLPLSGGMMGVGGTLAFGGQQGSRGAVWMDGVTLTVSNRDPGGTVSRYAFAPSNIDAVAKRSDVDAATSGKTDRSDLALYLPLSGGTVGTLTISGNEQDGPILLIGDARNDATVLTSDAFFFLNGGVLGGRLQIPADPGNYTIARTIDVLAATSGKADASAFDAYYTSAQTNTAISTAITSAIGDIDTVLDGINGEVI